MSKILVINMADRFPGETVGDFVGRKISDAIKEEPDSAPSNPAELHETIQKIMFGGVAESLKTFPETCDDGCTCRKSQADKHDTFHDDEVIQRFIDLPFPRKPDVRSFIRNYAEDYADRVVEAQDVFLDDQVSRLDALHDTYFMQWLSLNIQKNEEFKEADLIREIKKYAYDYAIKFTETLIDDGTLVDPNE